MGTSTSSSGGKAGSPFDPEWLSPETAGGDSSGGDGVDDGVGGGPEDVADGGESDGADGANSPDGADDSDAAFAPSRRFANARSQMSSYLSGGGHTALRGAAQSMVRKGMGGPRRAASTMRRTAGGAAALGQFLAAARDGTDQSVTDWVDRVRQANLSADDLILELVKEVMPEAGSVDDESLRNAAAEALGQLYELDPAIDLFTLTDTQIHDVMAITIANDVCNKMDLQLGQTYEKLKYDPHQIQLYRKDMREYVQSEVRVVMEQHGSKGLDPKRLSQAVLLSTLEVFSQW
ncbi:Qat anti-phage system associated protein QatB [Paraburkholderia heleia]|uniref:Qat anti-phage system associated protein QatB n=1 Tax=Paraburkholderia heleia TaxID=634127 RepID=UPI0031D5A564